jgi:hypothetical protein
MIPLRSSLALPALLAASFASLLVACSGDVIVDATGASGGSGGSASGGGTGGDTATTSASSVSTTSATAATTSTSTGGAADCNALQEDVVSKVAAAQACDPAISSLQCSGAVTALDLCGCTVAANEKTPEAAKLAVSAFDSWVKAGCGPISCLLCPPPPPDPWFCDPMSLVCKPAFVK